MYIPTLYVELGGVTTGMPISSNPLIAKQRAKPSALIQRRLSGLLQQDDLRRLTQLFAALHEPGRAPLSEEGDGCRQAITALLRMAGDNSPLTLLWKAGGVQK